MVANTEQKQSSCFGYTGYGLSLEGDDDDGSEIKPKFVEGLEMDFEIPPRDVFFYHFEM